MKTLILNLFGIRTEEQIQSDGRRKIERLKEEKLLRGMEEERRRALEAPIDPYLMAVDYDKRGAN